MTILIAVLIVATAAAVGTHFGSDCVRKSYPAGDVCVCNATHCDEAEPLTLRSPLEFALYTSSSSGLRYHHTKSLFDFFHFPTDVEYTIDTKKTYQLIEGFGGAFTDAAGIHINSLSAAARRNLMTSYFSPSGNRYTLGRVPIACSDFSTHSYSYADGGLETFQLAPEDYELKIPIIQEANELSGGKLQLTAAPWGSPAYMKTSNTHFSIPFGTVKVEYWDDWATYLIKFLEAYDSHNITIKWLSSQNEPTFPFTSWTVMDQAYWIGQHMGPKLANSRFNETTKLLALDDQRTHVPWYFLFLFELNPQNKQYFSAIGLHWYFDTAIPPTVLDKFHATYPDLTILPTEACITPQATLRKEPVKLGDWEAAENYTKSIIEDCQHWSAGWIDWNLALDPAGGPNWINNNVDAPVIVNATNDEFYKQPMFYALGHFSKFVEPGSRRVDLQGHHPGVEAVAFITEENNVVTVIHNTNEEPKSVSVKGIREFGQSATFVAPAKSITTFIANNNRYNKYHE